MKKTLAIPSETAAILDRLAGLTPESPRQWGKMTPHQAVCHLTDSFWAATGERVVSPTGNVLHRTVVKWIALETSLPWPKGVKTRPEVDQEIGGTKPADFARDVDQLRATIERFTSSRRGFEWAPHPIFGAMTDAEWLRWGYLHMDHHLRQFGA